VNEKRTAQRRLFHGHGLFALFICIAAAGSILSGTLLAFFHPEASTKVSERTLTFVQRVAYQRAIEGVYWRHRIWPKENAKPKPSLDEVISAQQIEKKVEDYLRDAQALEDYWQRPITPEQLQAEMERIAHHTKQPPVLREIFQALGDDPFVIAECLARPVLVQRVTAELKDESHGNVTKVAVTTAKTSASYTLPTISGRSGICTGDTWTATSISNAPAARNLHAAIWTGTEMIIWGGNYNNVLLNTGGAYDPSTDFWTATSTTNAPTAREWHTASVDRQ
jgi:hypothetical protein